MTIQTAPLELKHWTNESCRNCAFCSAAHAPFERRRSYQWNGRPITTRLAMCSLCKYLARFDGTHFMKREIDLSLCLITDTLTRNRREGA